VAGPAWVAGTFAAVMVMVAVHCASRLAISRLRRRPTEFDTDGAHVVMGVAMAGMLVPRLSPLPGGAWEAVFGAAAAWFGWQTIQARRGTARAGWRSPHPVPHLVECVAMLYMLLAVPGSRPAGGGAAGMAMAGMGGPAATAGTFPVLAVVLALFMVGYALWSVDQLTSLAHGRTTATPQHALLLAPRLAACARVAMSVTMGYMLILML
jgi:hypothetical protein